MPARATWGKQVLGLRIVRADGKPIGHGLALGRYLARTLSFLCLCIGVLMVGVTREKRGLHDMMCRTRVVYR
ncbi:RDD family protein [Aureimonas altamirensis]|uniref:RDD family protein n=1 Tax=Aureimonas altamirensis TaxID=370622 RepID=UPI003D816624